MGCHTWFYKPVIKTKEEIKTEVVDYLTEVCVKYATPEYIEILLANTVERDGYSITLEEINKQKSFYIRWLNSVVKETSLGKRACTYFYIHGAAKELTTIHNNTFYEEVSTHDLFRIGGYPDDVLTSYDETVKFCKTSNISISEEKLKAVYKFFEDHPNGIIEFG